MSSISITENVLPILFYFREQIIRGRPYPSYKLKKSLEILRKNAELLSVRRV